MQRRLGKLRGSVVPCPAQALVRQSVAMIRTIAEKLLEELVISFEDIIWGSGDIDPLPDHFDPVPFEEAVRGRFNRPRP